MGKTFHFQVNLGGMLDILSNHLYKTPDVFLRELLQNGADAIALRKKKESGWDKGAIHIKCVPGKKISFSDNGAGLTKEEIHQFLSVIPFSRVFSVPKHPGAVSRVCGPEHSHSGEFSCPLRRLTFFNQLLFLSQSPFGNIIRIPVIFRPRSQCHGIG